MVTRSRFRNLQRTARPAQPTFAFAALCLALIWLLTTGTGTAHAQTTIVEQYYIPLPESDLFQSFDTINSSATSPVVTTISIAIGGNTVIVYDQWENGYEATLSTPLNLYSSGASGCPPANPAGTQIWGNNNLCDGIAPGFTSDLLSSGDVILLNNSVPVPRNPAELRFDGADKVGSSYPIAITKLAFPSTPGSVLAGGVEVIKAAGWGTDYRAPVGQNLSGSTNPWEYARFFVMAGVDQTEVFKNGVSQGILNQGKNLVIPVNVNDRITANKPVQVDLITGDVNSSYEMRWYSLPPVENWRDAYYMPVGDGRNRVGVWFYNPNQTSAITVNWQIGTQTGSTNVPARAAVFGPLVGGSSGTAGGRFSTANGAPFAALSQIDVVDTGQLYDWGFPLVPVNKLSPQVLIGNGIGCTAPGLTIGGDSCVLGNVNNARSFVWVMPVTGTNVPIYVSYSGNRPQCPAPAGSFDQTLTLNALQIARLQQAADLDMTGARIWTCAPGVNLAVAWGQDPERSYSGDDQALDLGTLVEPLASIQLEKLSAFANDTDGDGAISPGDTITYTIAVVNNGAFPATFSVSDQLPPELIYQLQSTTFRVDNGPVTPVPDNLAPNTPFPLDGSGLSAIGGTLLNIGPGQVAQIAYVTIIDPATDCTLTFSNRAQVVAIIGATGGNITDDSEQIVVLQCNPGIRVEKSTNNVDADLPTGPFVPVGAAVTWHYTVTNIGDVALNNLQLTDNRLGPITTDCTPAIPATLAVGASFSCLQAGIAQPGQYANLATVRGTSVVSATQIVSDTDPSHYFGQSPAISLQKLTNGVDADLPTGPLIEAGAVVTWSYLVRNMGNVPLTGITVVDNQIGSVNCPTSTLAPGATMTCTATGIAQPGQYANLGTATGTPPVGPNVNATDPSHYFGVAPAIVVEKATNGEDADLPPGPSIQTGDFVLWTYVITNTGNVLLIPNLTDSAGVVVACPLIVLAPQQSTICNGTGIAVAGQYSNTATVIGTPPVGSPVTDSDPSHYFGEDLSINEFPEIRITKLTNGVDADLPPGPVIIAGSPVTWSYLIFNSGNITLTNVTVTDDQSVVVTCPEVTLAPLTGMICTATGTAQPGPYANIGSVTGTSIDQQETVTDTNPSHYFGQNAAVVVEKFTNGQDADTLTGPTLVVGTPVTWTYVVTNSGNVTLTNIVVTDDQGVGVSCPQPSLSPGASMICIGDQALAEPGQYTNLATVTALPPTGAAVEDTDPSHYFGQNAGIDIEKFTNGQDADAPTGPLITVGAPVTWTYLVTNTGNVPLTSVTVSDDQAVSVSCPQTTLAPGARMTCSATGVAQAGQYANVGTATGRPPVGAPVVDSDPSHYFGANAAFALEKLTNGEDADTPTGPLIVVGDAVNWNYRLTNTGNVPLVSFAVVDVPAVLIGCPRIGIIPPGGTVTCFGRGIATAGQYSNLATATAGSPVGPNLNDSDPSHYFGVQAAIDIEKATNGADADLPPGPFITIGDPVEWTYTVTNRSNVALTEVRVTDDQLGPITCPKATLAVAESMRCTATGIAAADQYSNTAEVIAIPPAGAEVLDSDPSHYFGRNPTALDETPQPDLNERHIFLPGLQN
jgi:uncharacterized repeat protein (TIGR01451 family)